MSFPAVRRRGVTLVEYGLLVMLVAIVAIGTVTALGGSVASPFADTTAVLNGSGSGGASLPTPDPETGPAAGMPELVCATGFEPGSTVIVNFEPIGSSLVSGGEAGALTADSSGEICEEVTIPIEAPTGDYSFELIGTAPGGSPHSVIKPPISVIGQDIDTTVPTPPVATGAVPTMTVQVRACSAVYLRANATMNSSGVLYPPGTQWDVFATNGWWNSSFDETLTGGWWPVYSCDGGADNTWYRLADGSGYVFTGGVDIISGPSFTSMSMTFDSAVESTEWVTAATIAWSNTGGHNALGALHNNPGATNYGPDFAVAPGQTLSLRGWLQAGGGSSSTRAGLCYRASEGGAISSCVNSVLVPGPSGAWREFQLQTSVPAGASFVTFRMMDNTWFDDIHIMLGVPLATAGTIDTANWDSSVLTDSGYWWAASSGGSGFLGGSGGDSRWYPVGPGRTATLTIDAIRNSGSSNSIGLQVGTPGDTRCAANSTAYPCNMISISNSTWNTRTITITTDYDNQWVRFVRNSSVNLDNMTLVVN